MAEALSLTSVVLLLALIPGYLTVLWWSRAKTWRGFPGDLHTILQSFALSLVMQIVLSPFLLLGLYPVRDHLVDHPYRVVGWTALLVIILPYVLGTFTAKFGDWVFPPGLRGPPTGWRGRVAWWLRPSPEPNTWDWAVPAGVFDGRFIVVEFKDGSRVAGAWARGGMATTSPEQPGIFLNEEWALDDRGNIYARVVGTRGVLIPDIREARAIRVIEQGEPR